MRAGKINVPFAVPNTITELPTFGRANGRLARFLSRDEQFNAGKRRD